jgi:hypothetical protein
MTRQVRVLFLENQMSEGIEVAQSSYVSDESTAAAAAFGKARGEIQEPIEVDVEPPEPEIVEDPKVLAGMTEKEITELLGEIPKYRKQIDNLAGNNGKLNAAIQKLQQEAPRGELITVTDEDMADLQDFPELANMTKSALNKVLGKLNTRGTGPVQTPDDYIALATKAAQQVATSERVKTHIELLDGLTPGWQNIIGLPDANGAIPDTEYRRWLSTQPADYKKRIDDSTNAFEIGSSVKNFNEAKEASAKKQQQNKQRLANAVQPNGQVAARSNISEQSAADKAFQASRLRS